MIQKIIILFISILHFSTNVPIENNDANEVTENRPVTTDCFAIDNRSKAPVKVDWEVLINIEYKLRYFPEVDMEMDAPVFNELIKSLDGKEIIIEGFVIPLDEEGEVLALSHNPYSSCFFCGNASPASIISMYLKDKKKRYKADDFKKFRGILTLNYDDPNEFYYILKEATAQ